ncbi:MAG: hypothetical protein CBD76_02210 [Pelagibacteraceae bacterium TMED216]|nr:MAG: hypothetical protein CBD76_02210 [Pelagibacteraceae bacterium TMED216]|tara:strand:- start:1095 stop:2030 length:936 start_codon:yes stop_codon:yes gene_type:complete
MNFKLKRISGDASFREFYRLKKGAKTSIIVHANKEKSHNLKDYLYINDILLKNKINAPRLLSDHYKDNIIEISDLGKQSFYDFIIFKKNKFKHYKKLIEFIIKLQNIKTPRKNSLTGYNFNLKKYSLKSLHKESDLFFDWYLNYYYKTKNSKKIKKDIKKELNIIYKKLYFKNSFFVHRDFHASNIILNKKKRIGIIDSQDAIIGNPLYDVVSLIDDVRVKISNDVQVKLLNYYHQISKLRIEKRENLKNDYDILSIQRNLKILGIFVRLFLRDNKPNYLKYLPYTKTLIKKRLENPIFNNLRILIKKYIY